MFYIDAFKYALDNHQKYIENIFEAAKDAKVSFKSDNMFQTIFLKDFFQNQPQAKFVSIMDLLQLIAATDLGRI